MKRSLLQGFVILCLILSACKNKVSPENTDNLYYFSTYISSHSQGLLSIADPIVLVLAENLEASLEEKELDSELFEISPGIEGKLFLRNGNALVFQPNERLKPDTEYKVTVHLGKLRELPTEFKTYTFGFKTIQPGFKIDLLDLQSYNRDWQYLQGILEASDVLDAKQLSGVIQASYQGNKIPVSWEETTQDSRYFRFLIDSIPRTEDSYDLNIEWDGNPVGVDFKGQEAYTIKGLSEFGVLRIKTTAAPQAMVSVNFSEPLSTEQSLNGLISLAGAENLRFETDGNILRIYPEANFTGDSRLRLSPGIQSTFGARLRQEVSRELSFEALKPAVRLISKGSILPAATSTPIYFETVSLKTVEVRVIQIYESNVLQYLQNNELSGNPYYDLRPVGRRVAYKKLDLSQNATSNSGRWQAHALNLSELITPSPGSIYRVEFSFGPEDSAYPCSSETSELSKTKIQQNEEEALLREEQYWDNEIYSWRYVTWNWEERENACHPAYYHPDRYVSTNVLGSDLGLIIKKGSNKQLTFITTNLLTATPEGGAKIRLYNFQQQPLSTHTTDAGGMVQYPGNEGAIFVVAEKDNHYAYAKLEDGRANSLSMFEIGGNQSQRGMKGFLYTERGVHRPGDPIHLTFVLDDQENPLPENHPVILEVKDPRGKLVQRNVLREESQGQATAMIPKRKGKFYYFPVLTSESSETGSWEARVIIGGAIFSKILKVATVKPNRLKLDVAFQDEVLASKDPIQGKLGVQWLHGAIARGLDFDINVQLSPNTLEIAEFPGFIFNDPIRDFNSVEIPWLNGKLDDNGVFAIRKNLPVDQKAPGLLTARFTTKVQEEGGDFSIDVFTKKLMPFSHLTGIKMPETEGYGSYTTDTPLTFPLVSVDAKMKEAPNRELQVEVFKIEWRWWWRRDRDNLSRYENASVHKPYKTFKVRTNGAGRSSFDLNIPEADRGRYLIRVIDTQSGHATGKVVYFFKNWWQEPGDEGAESAKMLLFSSDKETYQIGEKALIRFPSSAGSRALISIETGAEVIQTYWVDTREGETPFELPITAEMAPNIYAHISLLQPHGSVANDLPIRLYGLIPIEVENPASRLLPEIKMPDVLRPENPYTINISEKHGRAMTYSLAVVDEGLLDLTRFQTPDIHNHFYSKQALGVRTFDNFDQVMGAYSVSPANIYTIGGGDAALGAKNQKAQRFKPVVSYLGPFYLPAGENHEHELQMPNYIGAVRAMVVAGNPDAAYGKDEHSSTVKKPLMVLAAVPRQLSPGETVEIPVTVFAMEPGIKTAKVSVKASEAFEALGDLSKTLRFDSPGEQLVNFKFKIAETNAIQTLWISAEGHGESAYYEVELDVENPNPITTRHLQQTQEGEGTSSMRFETFGTTGTNSASVEISTLPPMDLQRRLKYLIRYPHGCVEQTTSSAFPQLFLGDVMELTPEQRDEIQENIRKAIERISAFQTTNGGLSYWPGEQQINAWGSIYGGHFMLEAQAKGYTLPLSFRSNWLRYEKKAARAWNGNTAYQSDLTQAYRLYTLVLAAEPDLASMNRLRNSNTLSNSARWRLAAAYAALGKKEAASDLLSKATLSFENKSHYRNTYGSSFRDRAMALEAMVAVGDSRIRSWASGIARELSSQKWFSTQETAYGLIALSKMVEAGGGKSLKAKVLFGDQVFTIESSKPLAVQELPIAQGAYTLKVENLRENTLYISLEQSGRLPVGKELATRENLQVSSRYTDANGQSLEVSRLLQGSSFNTEITVLNTSPNRIKDVALTQIVPGGWEIINTSYVAGLPQENTYDFKDIRDDRAFYYFDLAPNEKKTFRLKVNASFLGRYYLPGVQAEAMYDNTYNARNKGKWITVYQQ